MDDKDKLLKMFTDIHGEITGSCYVQVQYNDNNEAIGVSCMKDGNVCWTANKSDLLFDFITKNLEV